ncbi:signal recognition particle-docking protein FtsY [soil metagenome]|nr:signal recognition particle-docking protein FtsY [Trueperaceae bacterium]
MSWFDRLRAGLSKTRDAVLPGGASDGPTPAPAGAPVDRAAQERAERERTRARANAWEMDWDDLEFALIGADVGAKIAAEVVAEARGHRERGKPFIEALERALLDQLERDEMRQKLRRVGFDLDVNRRIVEPKGKVIMVVGVNGVGKTTTIAKLGRYYQSHGRSVVFAAGDTFRAAGSSQLAVWGDRLGIDTVTGAEGSDPAAVAFEGAQRRIATGADLLFVDTAGRLHTKHNLMEELKKVKRVIAKADPEEPKESWLVLDAVTGQNGLEQAKRFHDAVGLTGVIVTKLDGTGKGGILLPIARDLGLPIRFVGIGEAADDLQPYDAAAYVRALLDIAPSAPSPTP